MKEITLTKYHSILYKFFAVLCCFGVFMGAMDIISILKGYPLFLFKIPFVGLSGIIPLIPVMLIIILSYKMAVFYKKMGEREQWR